MRIGFVVAIAVLVVVSQPLRAADPPAAAPTRVVLVAGPRDHGSGAAGHAYDLDLLSMKGCLEASNVKDLKVEYYDGQVPDASVLQGAKVLVMESSGDRYEQEKHALFPFNGTEANMLYPPAFADKLKAIDAMHKAGMGIVVLHYAAYVNNATGRKLFTDWVGGFYESGYSRTLNTEWSMAPTATKHPVLRGVEPWTMREELYIRNRMPETDPERTPLLVATPTKDTPLPALLPPMVPGGPPSPSTSPLTEPSLVSWAVERKAGGRGFVMTGVHSHRLLQTVPYRREVLNGIVWAAGLEVPASGVVCELPPE